MKKFLTAIVAAGFIAAPAFAAKVTVSFANDDGTTQEWTFDDATDMATAGDITAPYTFDQEAGVLCADIPQQGEVCATFEGVAQGVGESAGYTLSTGGAGTATITAISE
ncbi:MAG: hypothetical protein AAFO74_03485 [Pseudomonadota bacterium]